MIPDNDRGLLLADGLFETILFKDGRPVLWDRHVDRMARGCAILGLEPPPKGLLMLFSERALMEAGLSQGRAAVRLTFSAGSGGRGLDRPDPIAPSLWSSAALSPPPMGPVRLALSDIRRNAGSPTSRLKSLAYLDNVLARRQARALGADEAAMLNGAGEAACCAAANLFWITGDRLFTPALDCGVLEGIMRGQVLARAVEAGLRPAEVHAPWEAVRAAEALFITNSLIGVRAVSALGDQTFEPDERVVELARACAELT